MAVTAERFFETQHTPSQVKSAILCNYFMAWSSIMTKGARQRIIGYLDLFAGRGRFEDGAESTPFLIIRRAVKDVTLRSALKTFFNDKDASMISALQYQIEALDGIGDLAYAPRFSHSAVVPEIANSLADFRVIPTFLFADPFGYMGISLRLLKQLLEHPKSEALIFFNTNRINAGITNEFVREHIDALFGTKRAEAVRSKVANLSGDEREHVILDSFQDGLKEIGFRFVLRFRFLSQSADRTSHHLVYCTRHQLGEKKMKDVMDRYSVRSFDGVPLFEIPRDEFGQGSLFDAHPLPPVDLAEQLMERFAGKASTLAEIVGQHSPGTQFVERNYRAALEHLIEGGRVTCDPPAEKMGFRQGKRIWPSGTRVVFPVSRRGGTTWG